MYLTHSEGKSVVAERLIRTLKNKIYKHMAIVQKDVYIYKLDDIKPIETKASRYIDVDIENKDKDPKFRVCSYVRI